MLQLKNQKVLVIAPHPDDEVLGCSGLIKRVKDEGGRVYVLFLTVGATRDFTKKGLSTAKERIREIEKVAKYLRFDGWRIAFTGDDHHLKLDNIPQKDIIWEIERGEKISLQALKPTILVTPQIADYNQDHRAATEAVFAATRPQPDASKHTPKFILGYESVPAEWSTLPKSSPNFFISFLNGELKTKVNALKLYKSQVRGKNHLRSPETLSALAHFRGAQCGAKHAEGYFVYKITS